MKNIKFLIRIGIWFLFTLMSISASYGQQMKYAGIPTSKINFSYAEQNSSQWCWAASTQMVLKRYGVNVNQKQIINRIYENQSNGNLPNWYETRIAIHINLDGWQVNKSGYSHTINAYFKAGPPTPEMLIRELSNNQPMIVEYNSDYPESHPVVIVGAYYIATSHGPMIQSIVIRDPWQNHLTELNKGKAEYPAAVLRDRVLAYWTISVSR